MQKNLPHGRSAALGRRGELTYNRPVPARTGSQTELDGVFAGTTPISG
jgi:hypothetical protein